MTTPTNTFPGEAIDTMTERPLTSDPQQLRSDAAELRAAILVLARRLRYQVAGAELSSTEAAVLGHLQRTGQMTPGQLARAEHVQPPSMTRVIENLERRGLIRRDPHPTDGRQVLVSHTDVAVAVTIASRELRTRWLIDRLAELDERDRRAIAAAVGPLERLAALP